MKQTKAFTLVELLVVIAIIGLLTALIVPAFRGIGGANMLTSATGMLVSELDLARQTALSENQAIEVRFYKLPDATGQDPQFRAMQRLRVSDGKVLDKISRLPGPIVMSGEEKFSTLLSNANGGLAKTTTVQGQAGVEYRSVQFRGSGSTALDARGAKDGSDRWFISLANQNNLAADASATKPADNFVTIQLDPVTGRTRTFQP